MERISTQNQIVRFIYREMSAHEEHKFWNKIEKNWALQEEYNLLKKSYRKLPKASFYPTRESLDRIRLYSRHASEGIHA